METFKLIIDFISWVVAGVCIILAIIFYIKASRAYKNMEYEEAHKFRFMSLFAAIFACLNTMFFL